MNPSTDSIVNEMAGAVEQTPVVPPKPPPAGEQHEGGESERERLLRTWRLHPDAEVDLCSEEKQGGGEDGTGVVHMTEKDGTEVDEFRFGSGEEADEAVTYALRALNPGM